MSASGDRRGLLVVLSGPSGVGKGTLVQRLSELSRDVWVSVSATTRAARAGETDGESYLFMGADEFDQGVRSGEFLEWATYAGSRYGTPRAPVEEHLRRGIDVLLEIDVVGARQVRAHAPQCLLVFVAPPSVEELARRLDSRGTESEADRRHRLDLAVAEMEAADEFDATIVNDDVGQAVTELLALMESRR